MKKGRLTERPLGSDQHSVAGCYPDKALGKTLLLGVGDVPRVAWAGVGIRLCACVCHL
jgi:hypothetical protein